MKFLFLNLGVVTAISSIKNNDYYNNALTVDCGVEFVNIEINRTLLQGEYNDIELRMLDFYSNDKCEFWKTKSIHHFKAELGNCGFQRNTNETHIRYSSHIKATLLMHDPSRIVMYSGKHVMIPVACTYPISLRTTLSINADTNVTVSVIELPSITGTGEFKAAMALYADGSFLSPLPTKSTFGHRDTFYVGVFLVDVMAGIDHRKLIMRNCWASPSNSSRDNLRFDLVTDPGCEDHSTVNIIENGEKTQARFSSGVFAFAGFDQVYLFCDISICFGHCEPTCSESIPESRKKRNVDDDYQIISLGPFHINVDEDVGWEESIDRTSSVNLRSIAISGGIVAIVLLLSLIAFFVIYRRRKERVGWNGMTGNYFSSHTESTPTIVAF